MPYQIQDYSTNEYLYGYYHGCELKKIKNIRSYEKKPSISFLNSLAVITPFPVLSPIKNAACPRPFIVRKFHSVTYINTYHDGHENLLKVSEKYLISRKIPYPKLSKV